MARRTVSDEQDRELDGPTLSENGDQPWSDGEEGARVRSGFPPWRSPQDKGAAADDRDFAPDERQSALPDVPRVTVGDGCECWTRRPSAYPGQVDRMWSTDCPVHARDQQAQEIGTWDEREYSAGAMTLDEAIGVATYVREHAPPDPDDASIVARNSATVILLLDALENARAVAPKLHPVTRDHDPTDHELVEWEQVLRVWQPTGPQTTKLHEAIMGMLGEVEQLRTELAESGEALTALETAHDVPSGSPIAANRPEWYVALEDYAGGGKGGGVKVLRPAARSALDELERCWIALSHSTPNADAAPAEKIPNADAEQWQDEQQYDAIRNEVLATTADELRTRFSGPENAWAAGWLSAAAWLVAETDPDSEYRDLRPFTDEHEPDEDAGEGTDEGAVAAELGEDAAYDLGWSDAVEDGIGEQVWAGAPLRWRFVQSGDVVLTGSNSRSPAGVPWMVRNVAEGARSFDLDVHVVSGDERDRATVDPDGMVTVLLPAAERAAIVALRKGLGARVSDRGES